MKNIMRINQALQGARPKGIQGRPALSKINPGSGRRGGRSYGDG
jgi:hypothetical protein